MTFITFVLI